jgi:hypothetical protein
MKNIDELILKYKSLRKKCPDRWLIDCENESNIDHVIEMASKSRDSNNRKHPHQYRIKNKTLDNFCDNVMSKKNEILKSTDFAQLYNVIKKSKINGIGDLTIYDTAHRIGKHLEILPNKVYIHCGTKIGAERILKNKIRNKFIDKSMFKKFSDLTCEEIEDILCIYKDGVENKYCIRVKRIKNVCG